MPWASSKGAEEAAGHCPGHLQAWKKLGPLSQPGPRRREHNQGHDVVSRAESRSYQPQEGNTRAISECPGVQVLTGQRGVGRQAGISCQEKTREVGNLSQVTKANGHPCDDNVVFVGNDLLMGFYLIKLDRLGQHLCS